MSGLGKPLWTPEDVYRRVHCPPKAEVRGSNPLGRATGATHLKITAVLTRHRDKAGHPTASSPLHPNTRHLPEQWACPRSANRRQMQCSKQYPYSITSSASASTVGGIVRPSVFTVLRLKTNSNFVGCTTGRLAGFSPFRIRPV